MTIFLSCPIVKTAKFNLISNMKLWIIHTIGVLWRVNDFQLCYAFIISWKVTKVRKTFVAWNTYAIFKRLLTLHTFTRKLPNAKVAWIINKIVPLIQNKGLKISGISRFDWKKDKINYKMHHQISPISNWVSWLHVIYSEREFLNRNQCTELHLILLNACKLVGNFQTWRTGFCFGYLTAVFK